MEIIKLALIVYNILIILGTITTSKKNINDFILPFFAMLTIGYIYII